MGTMIQAANPTLSDFQGHDGCNEILNVTRPEMIAEIHRAYLDVGVDAIETNTFGANLGNLSEYGIPERTYELAHAGALIARRVADEYSPTRWVLGSLGPGTKLPTLGHVNYQELRDSYEDSARGLIDGGADALLVETTQDLLQAKAAINGSRRAIARADRDIVLIAQITVETNGAMLLGSEVTAALNALSCLDVDLIGMNCATGPAEMSEHLRQLSQSTELGISCMPNAGLPVLQDGGAHYPLTPKELASFLADYVDKFGLNLIGGCCGTTPAHLGEVVELLHGKERTRLRPVLEPGASSLYQFVPFKQAQTYLSIGERSNANGSRAFRDALLAADWQSCVDIAKDQIRDGAHLLDLSVDYVGRDGVADMSELAGRLATAATLPIVIDSTEPDVIQAALERLGGRSVINSVNYEDGDGAKSRFARIMPLVKEHGAAVIGLTIDENGQARTASWKLEVAERLIKDLTGKWGMNPSDIIIDCLTFPVSTGQEETRRDALETLSAIKQLKARHPAVQTVLGISNVSFGLNPVARSVLNSVFLAEAVNHGLDAAIIHPSKILPIVKIPDEQRSIALDLIYDRRIFEGENCIYDPLQRFLALFEGITSSRRKSRAEELAELPIKDRLVRRIIEGEKKGLAEDLEEARGLGLTPLSIINDYLLTGMKEVGELFGRGEMQLPFVLQSAEVMKMAVSLLEPYMEKVDTQERGAILLATVKGDVHDIGKNLVDIILSNNGYRTFNIGIKQTINQIIEGAEVGKVDVIGMSGLLVKSTVIMRENLQELTTRGLADKWPIILGGAALTRSYVESDLAGEFPGTVRYAKDAFEGLALMDAIMGQKRGLPGATLPPLKERRTRRAVNETMPIDTKRSDVAENIPLPKAPFWGSRVIKGIQLADYVKLLDERALFVGQWGLSGKRGEYEEMANEVGRPRLRSLLNEAQSSAILNAAVAYGYFPCFSDGNRLIILDPEKLPRRIELTSFDFPRQRRDRRLCIADFFRSSDSEEVDVVAFHLVTMGSEIGKATSELFESNQYRDYLELHGLSVQLTEALAEYWHSRIREELGIGTTDSHEIEWILDQGYRGSRYSFGYPACPDLSQQVQLVQLLGADRIGVSLSEEFQLHPEQSTSAIIVHHPEAKYFNAN